MTKYVCACTRAHTHTHTHTYIGDIDSVQFSSVSQSCRTLCDPMDYTVHGILQARILEWVAIPFSRGLPNPGIKPRSPALHADFLSSEPPSPILESLIHSFTPATDSIMLKCYHRLSKDTDVFFQKDIS